MRVLMATDGSKTATKAMQAACRILSATDREVDLTCVVPEAGAAHQAHRKKLCRRAAHILEQAKRVLEAEGVSAQTALKTGSPARVLIGACPNYDVSVIGASSRRDGSTAGLGPIVSRVLEHSNATILVGRELRSETGIKILIAVDGSEGSVQALDTVVRLIDVSSADVTLLQVAETPWLHSGLDQEWLGYEEEKEEEIDPQVQFEREFVREAEEIVEAARERLPVRTTVSTLIYEGLPADEILSEAERGEYDLVVIGASGATDLKHQMLGSVSSKVAWNAPCSVLVVRSGE
jgi:nucleotide-binding universal stress UspA family protein